MSSAVADSDKSLNELVGKLRTAFAEDLVSVVLYGSAATGDHHRNFSDFNVLCVLREITPRQLAASEPIMRWWKEIRNGRRKPRSTRCSFDPTSSQD